MHLEIECNYTESEMAEAVKMTMIAGESIAQTERRE